MQIDETAVRPPRTGLEAFEMLPEGTLCQLINDAIIMSPAPTPSHQGLLDNLFYQLKSYVKKYKLGEVFFSPIDVYLNKINICQPDIVFISAPNLHIIDWHKGIMGTPDLIIEILSNANRSIDLVTKKKVYEKCGVKEYWVVDALTKWCGGFQLENGTYQLQGKSEAQITLRLFDLNITF